VYAKEEQMRWAVIRSSQIRHNDKEQRALHKNTQHRKLLAAACSMYSSIIAGFLYVVKQNFYFTNCRSSRPPKSYHLIWAWLDLYPGTLLRRVQRQFSTTSKPNGAYANLICKVMGSDIREKIKIDNVRRRRSAMTTMEKAFTLPAHLTHKLPLQSIH
jgi:hypothetical protein